MTTASAVHPSRARQAGFTMFETMIATTLLIMLLGGAWTSMRAVNDSIAATSQAADLTTAARRTMRTVSSFLRPAKLSSFLAQAVAADVSAGLATTVGQWIPPSELVRRPGVQFTCASGLLSMNAALTTSARDITLTPEAGEIANGVDDDNDGLIDESRLALRHDLVTVTVVHDVEECSYLVDGRMMVVRLRLARAVGTGPPQRVQVEQAFYLRNN